MLPVDQIENQNRKVTPKDEKIYNNICNVNGYFEKIDETFVFACAAGHFKCGFS